MTTSTPHASLTPAPDRVADSARARRAALVCLLACMAWFGFTSGLRPLAIPDEGRYVGVAWEMVRSGDWSVPLLNGAPFFHKPPLFYWITAASIQLFGPGVMAARAAPWLGAVATTFGLYLFLARWGGPRIARSTAWVLATLPLFFGGAQYANLDMLVASLIAGAILFFAHALLCREAGERYRGALLLSFASAGAGVLAKGMIGAVLPVLTLLAWGASTQRLGRVARQIAWAPGWVLFGLIVAPWFVAMQARFPGFLHYFFIVQQVDRFKSVGYNNPQPFYFYVAVLALLTLPWSPWALRAAYRWRTWRGAPRGTARDLVWLMLAWLAVVTLFFSLPDSKLIGYILPALAPFAFLIAQALPTGRFPWRRATTALAAVVCVGGAVAAHYGQPKSRAAIARQLLAARKPGEPVYFLQAYYYDVAFYARLAQPVQVADAWLPAELAKDSWRRELADAEGFVPGTPSRRLDLATLGAAVCKAGSAWLVGPWPAPAAPSWLADLPSVYQFDGTALWHLDTAAPGQRAIVGCDAAAVGSGPRAKP